MQSVVPPLGSGGAGRTRRGGPCLPLREGFELILLGVGEYGQDREEVRSIVLSTRGLTGQDVRDDPRVAEWGRLAAAALDSEIVEPGLNDRPAERVAARV